MDVDRSSHEFAALRQAIASRGQLRSTLALAGLAVWGLITVAVLIQLPYPVVAAIPLTVLWATFEVVRSLHFGAERIGRYIQVFHEEDATGSPGAGPGWETTAMALGPAVPGAAGHPLLAPVFAVAVAVNFLAVILPGPLASELGLMAVPHVALLAWLVRADQAMRAQRTTELARFRALRDGTPTS